MPHTAAEVDTLSWQDLKFVFAISYAQAIRAFVDRGEDALRSELEQMGAGGSRHGRASTR